MLVKEHPVGEGVSVSHEEIFSFLLVQSCGMVAKQPKKHLRTRRTTRRNDHNSRDQNMAISYQEAP